MRVLIKFEPVKPFEVPQISILMNKPFREGHLLVCPVAPERMRLGVNAYGIRFPQSRSLPTMPRLIFTRTNDVASGGLEDG
jgi:hypothetical protein